MSKILKFASVILPAGLIFFPLTALTQNNETKEVTGKDVIEKFTAYINETPGFEADFTFVARDSYSQELSRGKTNLKVQGTLFRMTNESAEVYCDGTTKWIINEQAAEVTIIKNDPASIDETENPMSFLNNLKNDYSVQKRVLGRSIKGKDTYMVQLSAIRKKAAWQKIFLTVDAAAGYPITIDIHSSNGNIYSITGIEISKIRQQLKSEDFKPSQTRLKGLYINDLR